MNDILRNPLFYFIAIPVLLAGWVCYTALILLPASNDQWAKKKEIYKDAQPLIKEIVTLAPERVVAAKEKKGDFDYDKAIDKTARLCSISPSNITPNIRGKMQQARQTVQDAVVSINDVGIREFAMFLSLSLHLWPDLQCERLKLTQIRGPKNKWKADVNFKYFY